MTPVEILTLPVEEVRVKVAELMGIALEVVA